MGKKEVVCHDITCTSFLADSRRQRRSHSALGSARYRAPDFPVHLTGISWWGPEDRRSGDGELNVVG